MSHHTTTFQGSIPDAIERAVKEKLEDAVVSVRGGGGHYEIDVVSQAFAGKSTLEKQRLVLSAIAQLMQGPEPPVHAVDRLRTTVPAT